MEKVFLNDRIVDATEAHISVTDSGLLYGMGLFETMRCNNGKVFAIEDHLERLFNSIKVLALLNTYDKNYIKGAIGKVIEASGLSDARVRLTLTNGTTQADQEQPEPTLLITATEFTPYPAEYYQKGVTVILTDFRQNPTDPTCGHKTTSFFPRLLALNNAHSKRAAEALWFTDDNRLAEGCVSNVFVVKDSVLHTPLTETPILPGVARKTVLQIAEKESIEFVEKDITISELLGADEVFVTNIIMLVLPVVQVEAHTVGDGKPGTITKKLIKCINDTVSQKQDESRDR